MKIVSITVAMLVATTPLVALAAKADTSTATTPNQTPLVADNASPPSPTPAAPPAAPPSSVWAPATAGNLRARPASPPLHQPAAIAPYTVVAPNVAPAVLPVQPTAPLPTVLLSAADTEIHLLEAQHALETAQAALAHEPIPPTVATPSRGGFGVQASNRLAVSPGSLDLAQRHLTDAISEIAAGLAALKTGAVTAGPKPSPPTVHPIALPAYLDRSSAGRFTSPNLVIVLDSLNAALGQLAPAPVGGIQPMLAPLNGNRDKALDNINSAAAAAITGLDAAYHAIVVPRTAMGGGGD